MPCQDLLLLSDYQNNEFVAFEIFLCHPCHVVGGDHLDPVTVVFPIIGILFMASHHLVVGKDRDGLSGCGEVAREGVGKGLFRREEFGVGDHFCGDSLDLLKHD